MPRVRQADPVVIGNLDVVRRENNNLNFSIDPFYGDPSSLGWFINQIQELRDLNNWQDQAALFYLKSKLKGSAQQFFATSPTCKNVRTFNEAIEILKAFFSEKQSDSLAIADFNSLHMLPNESIKNFAYRIDTAAHAAYSFIENPEALNKIKSIQFLNALPTPIKTQLIFEDQADFLNLVEKANQINSAHPQSVAQINYVKTNDDLSQKKEFAELKEQVTQLTSLVNSLVSLCPMCKGEHTFQNCPQLKAKEKNNVRPNNVVTRNVPNCHYCGKRGHIMAKCYAYLRTVNQTGNQPSTSQLSRTNRPQSDNQRFQKKTFNRPQHPLN